MDHIISISPDGTVRTLYTERIDLREFGTLDVQRASDVEFDECAGGWTVFLREQQKYLSDCETWDATNTRIHACEFHAKVFWTREEALKAEVDYLQARL